MNLRIVEEYLTCTFLKEVTFIPFDGSLFDLYVTCFSFAHCQYYSKFDPIQTRIIV